MSATPNFMQAKCFHHANRERVDLIVVHTMELPCQAGMAKRLGEVFRDLDTTIDPTTKKPRHAPKSAHFGVDPTEVWQYVREADVAWHAPKANARGIGIEHAGRALDARDNTGRIVAPFTDWTVEPGLSVLKRSAALVARLCQAWKIPPVKLGPSDLLRAQQGICGHRDVTIAYPGSGSHVDPGPRWPWALYLDLVAKEVSKLGARSASLS
jgi:N-acetyl-anhydromuramyl-L-alanine amidase AmpD